MDNFMDKLAQKLTAQEMIRANEVADAAELERLEKQTEVLQNQMNEYNTCLQEMRKLNLKNVESAQNIQELSQAAGANVNQMVEVSAQGVSKVVEESLAKIEAVQVQMADQSELKDGLNGLQENLSGLTETLEELKQMIAANKTGLEEQFRKTEEYMHTENVKVYRNVQASMIEELGKQTDAIIKGLEGNNKGYKILLPFSIITMIVSFATLGVFVCRLLGLI